MHRSWNSGYLSHYSTSLKTLFPEHHGDFGAKTHTHTQISRPSASGTGSAKHQLDIIDIDNGVDIFGLARDHVVIQAQVSESILTNSDLKMEYKSRGALHLEDSTCFVLHTTSDTSMI
jgi:hypothetical protein